VEAAGGELTMRAAYRLARPGAAVRRVDLDVLDVLCEVLGTTPGELLEYTPGKPKRKRG
jgi:DNA-binding Xre family transcriptional regulator